MLIKVVSNKPGLALDHDILCNRDMSDEEALELARECNPDQSFSLGDVQILKEPAVQYIVTLTRVDDPGNHVVRGDTYYQVEVRTNEYRHSTQTESLDAAYEQIDRFKALHPSDSILFDDARPMSEKCFKKTSTGMTSYYWNPETGEKRFNLHEGLYVLDGFDQPVAYVDVPGVLQPDVSDIYKWCEANLGMA